MIAPMNWGNAINLHPSLIGKKKINATPFIESRSTSENGKKKINATPFIESRSTSENGHLMEEVIWFPETNEEDKSNKRDDVMEVISLDGDEEDYEKDIDKIDDFDGDIILSESQTKLAYFDKDVRKNHKFITYSKATTTAEEEEEEVDIEDAASDSDVEEIPVIENETIEIPDDDDDDTVISDVKTNGADSYPKRNNTESSTEKGTEKESSLLESSANHLLSQDPPSEKSDKPQNENDNDCIISSPKTLSVSKILVKPYKKILLRGIGKNVFTAENLKSGLIPMKSLIGKSKPINLVPSNFVVKERNSTSLIKPASGIILKGKGERLRPTNSSISLLKERREPQSILKSSQNRGADNSVNNHVIQTIASPPPVKAALCCLQCSSTFTSDKELRTHLASKHPKEQQKEVPHMYSPAAILELERELKDQSVHCTKCSKGFWYLPTLRAHATVHPAGQNGCEACKHGMVMVKQFINHLEEHADSIDSD